MKKQKLKSADWFSRTGKDGFNYRSWFKKQGIPQDELEGKPIIGICNTWSELTPCNSHFRELADFVKRGIWDVAQRLLHLHVNEQELLTRKSKFQVPDLGYTRGYTKLFIEHVLQPEEGDFLKGCSGSDIQRDSH
jgi:dihydroxyacid dehydratase/phosphogluconate dehydratase